MNLCLTALAAMIVVSGVASADDVPLAYKHVNAPLPAEPAPVLRIVQPAADQVNTTHETVVPGGQSYDRLKCLVEEKDRVIRIAADHWTVKPGGPGVLVVVDGIFAATIHDLTRPLRLEDLEPFDDTKTNDGGTSPLASCGWHWVAVMPTTATGQMLDVPPTVSWYMNKSDNTHWSPRMPLAEEKAEPLAIINWPLMGAYVPKFSFDEPAGIVVSTSGKLMFDYTMAQHPGCNLAINFDQHHDDGDHDMKRHGLEVVEHFTSEYGKDQVQYIEKCADGQGGGGGWTGMTVYTKAPPTHKALRWPTMSAEVSAKKIAAEHAAHRIPGKKPYDGTFLAQGGGGMGSLACPSPLQITNASASFPVMLGRALSFGVVKIVIDADGYIQPQTFTLGKPKRLKGKAGDDELDAEARGISAVIVSGELHIENVLDSRGRNVDDRSVALELKIEAVDASGSKTGRECNQVMRKDGHFVKASSCSHDAATCGGGGELPCC